MAFIKIGLRNNLIYPILFMILVNILRIIKIIIEEYFHITVFIIYPLLMFISTPLSSTFIYYFIQQRKNPDYKQTSIMGIPLIKTTIDIENKRIDKSSRIMLLLFFCGFFDFIFSLRLFYFYKLINKIEEIKNLDTRLRSREILYASILCYLTIRIKLYKHHKISLFIILFFVLITLFIEIYRLHNKKLGTTKIINYIILQIIIGIYRIFPDIIEKYLMEYNYLNPYKILIITNTFEIFFISFFYFSKEVRNEFPNIKESLTREGENPKFKIVFCIILLILFFFVSSFKNIYRILTIKAYSPITRTLFDSILDIFIYLWNTRERIFKREKDSYFLLIILFCKIIILFASIIYNELLVLYCCGMEKNTHLEIQSRSLAIELPENIIDGRNNNLDSESDL